MGDPHSIPKTGDGYGDMDDSTLDRLDELSEDQMLVTKLIHDMDSVTSYMPYTTDHLLIRFNDGTPIGRLSTVRDLVLERCGADRVELGLHYDTGNMAIDVYWDN